MSATTHPTTVFIFLFATSSAFSSAATGAMITAPTGLNPGDEYRLAFVTAGTRTGSAMTFAPYDTFVTNEAESNAEMAALGTTWKAIVSVPGGSGAARLHTDTVPAGGAGLPVFRRDGVKIADDYEDLWDGAIAAFLSIDQNGDEHLEAVWTGTATSGLAKTTLGGANATHGFSNQNNGIWLDFTDTATSISSALYGISDVLTVGGVAAVPEPSGGALMTVGFALLSYRRRRKRNHALS